jgi:hypothetical protein
MHSFIILHCQSISYSVLPDKNYAAGFLLSQSNRSTSIPQGKLELGGEAKGEKSWRISQWWSINNDLTNAVYSKTGNTHTYQALVDGSRLTVDPVAGSISLGLSASKEYGLNGITSNPRANGEAWPHLLLEQGLSRYEQVKISDKKEIRMDITYNVTKIVDMMPAGTTNPGLHTCMLNWYTVIVNRNVNSPDYGKFFHFGLNYYDFRYDFAAEYAAQDAGKVGATDAFIYKPSMQPLMVTKTVIGQPKTVNVDIYTQANLTIALNSDDFKNYLLPVTATAFMDKIYLVNASFCAAVKFAFGDISSISCNQLASERLKIFF